LENSSPQGCEKDHSVMYDARQSKPAISKRRVGRLKQLVPNWFQLSTKS
jgi:hypothetical protein